MIKKLTFVLFSVLGSASALATRADDMPLPAASGVNLIAPHQEGSWSFALQANYFQPNNDFNYAVGKATITQGNILVPAAGIFTQTGQKTYAVNSNNDWGWGADITYHFPGEGRDVTLAFTQLNSSDSDSVNAEDANLTSLTPTGVLSGSKKGTVDDASGKVNTNYDAVDLTFGQLITAGSRITLHPFAGLRYAYIDYKATGTYSTIIDNGGGGGGGDLVGAAPPGGNGKEDTQTLKSTFSGAGPRLGSDASVNLGSGFSLRGTLGVSLLVGSIDVDADYTTDTYSSNVLTNSSDTKHSVDTNTRVVPEADAKLSALYHKDLDNGYALGFEAGYQVTNYFDAIQNNTTSSTVDTSTSYTDFFMQGPFARIQLDVA